MGSIPCSSSRKTRRALTRSVARHRTVSDRDEQARYRKRLTSKCDTARGFRRQPREPPLQQVHPVPGRWEELGAEPRALALIPTNRCGELLERGLGDAKRLPTEEVPGDSLLDRLPRLEWHPSRLDDSDAPAHL